MLDMGYTGNKKEKGTYYALVLHCHIEHNKAHVF